MKNLDYIYMSTDKDDTNLTGYLSAALSEDASFKGGLGFFQLDAKNKESVNDNVKINDPQTGDERQSWTEMDVTIDLDLNNSDGLGRDGALTFKEITNNLTNSAAIKNLFNYDIQGHSALSLGVETSINGSAAIPSFGFDLASDFKLFDYSNEEKAKEDDQQTSIYFDNIKLDLGSYISNMLSPVVDGIDDILTPLYPVVDALYSDTQIFNNLGLVSTFDDDKDGQVSPIDLSNWTARFSLEWDETRGAQLHAAVKSTTDFLERVKGVMDLVRDLEQISASGENFYLDYGSYTLSDFAVGDSNAEKDVVETGSDDAKNLNDDTEAAG